MPDPRPLLHPHRVREMARAADITLAFLLFRFSDRSSAANDRISNPALATTGGPVNTVLAAPGDHPDSV